MAPRITRVALNVGSVQMVPNETIGEALRCAEAVLLAKRNEARRGDTMPRETPDAQAAADAQDELAPTPSALMSLIPVGEVSVGGR